KWGPASRHCDPALESAQTSVLAWRWSRVRKGRQDELEILPHSERLPHLRQEAGTVLSCRCWSIWILWAIVAIPAVLVLSDSALAGIKRKKVWRSLLEDNVPFPLLF